jgi:hypothetical protein
MRQHPGRSIVAGLASGFAAGVGLMYLIDPERGRARRALARDRLRHDVHEAQVVADATVQDVANRLRGVVAEVRGRLRDRSIGDDVLVERVRARLGRAVSHPHLTEVAARDGVVTLSGPILADEVAGLMAAAKRVRGVKHIDNRLSPHEHAEMTALQGGHPLHSDAVLQRWPESARMAAGIVGGALLLRAVTAPRRGGASLATIGSALALRAITNRPLRRLLATRPPVMPAAIAPRAKTGNGHVATTPRIT